MSIVLEHLTKRYGGQPVVNNVSLEVKDGEFFVLFGSSGSGKTTILSLIAGLTSANQGRILLNERDVTYLPTQQRKVGFVFQNYALFQYMTVADNVEFGLSVRKSARGLNAANDAMNCWNWSDWRAWATACRASFRAVNSSAWPWHAPWPVKPEVLLLDEPLGASGRQNPHRTAP
jgi:sulfate/thiosulfate transport system ATP-binding protein